MLPLSPVPPDNALQAGVAEHGFAIARACFSADTVAHLRACIAQHHAAGIAMSEELLYTHQAPPAPLGMRRLMENMPSASDPKTWVCAELATKPALLVLDNLGLLTQHSEDSHLSIGRAHFRLAGLADSESLRFQHLQQARDRWSRIDRQDLVERTMTRTSA